jgi:hypothetical protein
MARLPSTLSGCLHFLACACFLFDRLAYVDFRLRFRDLSDNRLSGSLPSGWGKLTALVELYGLCVCVCVCVVDLLLLHRTGICSVISSMAQFPPILGMQQGCLICALLIRRTRCLTPSCLLDTCTAIASLA